MKNFRVLALALALAGAGLLSLAPASQAQAPPPFMHSYLTFSGGAYLPEGTDLDDNDADTGFAGFLNAGFMMNPFVGVQTDLGYFETSGDNNLKVEAFPIVVSLKFAIPIAFVEPYILGGGGVYFTSTEITTRGITSDDNNTEFAPHAAAGINFNFGRFTFGAESRYLWLEAGDLDVDGLMILGKVGARF